MQIEIVALRHQLAVLQRRTNKRASLRTADRWLWVLLSRVWEQWRSALVIVKQETVIAWQRKGFRLALDVSRRFLSIRPQTDLVQQRYAADAANEVALALERAVIEFGKGPT